jgi:hypothetical protein
MVLAELIREGFYEEGALENKFQGKLLDGKRKRHKDAVRERAVTLNPPDLSLPSN